MRRLASVRIAIPIHAFEPGGVERVGLRLAERWQAEGHEVDIVLGRDRGTCRSERPALPYLRFREPLATDGWETLWMMICLTRFLLRERVDAVFCPGLTYTAPCVVARVLLGRRCPPVLVKVSNDLGRDDLGGLLRWPYRLWLWVQGRLLDHFVAIGEPMRADIASSLGIGADRVAMIPDPALSGSDLAALSSRHPRHRQDDGRRFLAVGRLAPQKNFALLLQAFSQARMPGDQLVIAGEGPERAKLQAQGQALGIAAQVQFAGHAHDMPALYREADVLVVSSDYEGVPAVVIEALAAGLPVAATDCCASMDWLLGEGRFGVLATRHDATSLAQAMTDAFVLAPPAAERQQFASQFTLERASGTYLALLADLARRKCAPPREKFTAEVREPRLRDVLRETHSEKAH